MSISRQLPSTVQVKSVGRQFQIGAVAAEFDTLLSTSYVDNGTYASAVSQSDKRCFVIGRTGSGKSSLFREIQARKAGHVTVVSEKNLSLSYLSNLYDIRLLHDTGISIAPFLRILWRHVLVVEILKMRLQLERHPGHTAMSRRARSFLRRDSSLDVATKYLREYGDEFWLDVDERIRRIADLFSERVSRLETMDQFLELETNDRFVFSAQRELVQRLQRVVGDIHPRLLDEVVEALSDILGDDREMTYVLIDDLDRNWLDQGLLSVVVRTLLDTVMELQRTNNLKILVALRTNIFHSLTQRLPDREGKLEKYEALSLKMMWTEKELHGLLEKRVENASVAFGIEPPLSLRDFLPGRSEVFGNPVRYVLSRTLLRPRDAIAFLNLCIGDAVGRIPVTWDDLFESEMRYSEERLLALRDEWKIPYLGIERVLHRFNHQPARLGRGQLASILDDVALEWLDSDPSGASWLSPLVEPIWSSGVHGQTDDASWSQVYGPLTEVLYEISFLGIASASQMPVVYSYEDADYRGAWLNRVRSSAWFEVHPAFRRALETT